jgi:hypothetical protein
MATTYTHAKFSVVDESSNVNVIYPQTTGADVSIDRSQNTTIPSGVTNAQQLANKLAASAFASNINDSATSATSTWSSNKINSQLAQLSSDLLSGNLPCKYIRLESDSAEIDLNTYTSYRSLYYFDGNLLKLKHKPRNYNNAAVQLWMLVTEGGWYHTQIVFPSSRRSLAYRSWAGSATPPYWSYVEKSGTDTSFDDNF